MSQRFRRLLAPVLAGACALGLLTSCGTASTAEEVDVGELLDAAAVSDATGEIEAEFDFDGADLWVGSAADSDDTTSVVLGAVLTAALDAGGADVRHRSNISGETLVRDEIVSGEIDMAWLGTGFAWTVLLRQPAQDLSGTDLYQGLLATDVAQSGIVWLEPLAFDQTTGVAVATERADDLDLDTLTDMADFISEFALEPTFCATDAFFFFEEDGLAELESELDIDLSEDALVESEPQEVYADTAAGGGCMFGEVSTTSANLIDHELSLLEDDASVFPVNQPAVAVREAVLVQNPDLAALASVLSSAMTLEDLQEMNYAVAITGDDPALVAERWLRSQGLIT